MMNLDFWLVRKAAQQSKRCENGTHAVDDSNSPGHEMAALSCRRVEEVERQTEAETASTQRTKTLRTDSYASWH